MKKPDLSGFACFTQKLEVAPFPGNTLHDLVVLESDPEQGYFFGGALPEEMKKANDHHLYLVVKQTIPCFQDKIIQKAYALQSEHKTNFHLSPGQIIFENKPHSCIRVRVHEIDHLKTFIDELEEMGVEFYCKRRYKHMKPYTSLVMFKKYVELEKTGEAVYRNMNDAHIHFVEIPSQIDYPVFETMREDIRNNCELNMFHMALIYIYSKEKVHNLAAIYSNACNEERLPLLAEFLHKEIQRLL
ncbi:hypothetical protein LA303_10705 [Candidatus Sulfidibacterium hydrothermale]|uniref:hypothetical protein n=1 Tax=Candidatus Sulfidibacterium hydrothermale TaxID=2875962 RepID=UPI001F0B10A5|nr:hypothetical protein [Candidatus Sulfidibacterium hydrothermale]UBM61874.1 hypothetical protein LA303_10705 [Candidatus Sulfidibacterium hydrothermale]